MTTLDQFLEKYLYLETAVKRHPKLPDTILEYENTLDTDTAEKMRLCRIIRNYCRHHDDYKKFAEASSGMVSFLDSQIKDVENYLTHVKDAAKRIKPVSVKDNFQTMVNSLSTSSLRILPVEDASGNIIGIVDSETVLEMLKMGPTMKTPVQKLINDKSVQKHMCEYTEAESEDLLEKYNREDILLVKSKGKYKGLYKKA